MLLLHLTWKVLPLYTQVMEKSPSRWWDLPSAALFMLSILISTWRLTITDWTDHLGYVTNLAVTAAILGLALGASRFGKRGVTWLALGYTLVFIPRQLIAFYDHDIYLGERLASAGGRLLVSIGEFAGDKPVQDPLFFITLIGILYWAIALASGYQLARHNNMLAAILPAGLTMLVIHQADQNPADRLWIIALYLFVMLTLLGRGKYLRDRAAWVKRGVQLAPEIGPELGMSALVGAAALILLAWNLPLKTDAPALEKQWRAITRPWRATRDRLGRAFDALEGTGKAERTESFRSSLSLGSRAAQGSTTIFKVSAPPETAELPRLFWRARVYDHYENGIWSESLATTAEFSPEDRDIPIPDLAGRTEYEFVITSYSKGQAILNLPAQPVWVSRPANVISFSVPNGTQDVLFIQTFPFLEPGETVHVRAAMANPSIEELLAAGTNYPDWVKERYLQLPEDFSPRVRNLASQITSELPTPYEQAQAITTFLRAEITYQPNLTLPPTGTDLIEWFLFDGKHGYCNYYASAETLMLRSLGIPARLAVGFAQGDATEGVRVPGETEAASREFTVRRKNMHAWPEVYFPGIGWVEFEPTGNQYPLVRPETHRPDPGPAAPPESQPAPKPTVPLEEETPNPETSASDSNAMRWLPVLGWSAASLLAAAAWIFANRRFALTTRAAEYVLLISERRGERFPSWIRNAALFTLADPFERAFHPVNVNLRRLGKSPAPQHTPAERAASLKAILPSAEQEIEILLREYQSAQYSAHAGDLRAARRASRRLLWLGLRARLRHA